MDKTSPIKNIEIFASGKKALSSLIGLDPEKLNKVAKISVSDELEENNYEIKPPKKKDDLQELVLGRKLYKSVIDALFDEKDNQNSLQVGKDYIVEDTEEYPFFSEQEQKIHDVLVKATGILRRIYNRRTGLFSWGLLGVLKFLGFKELGLFDDDFEKIEKEILKDPEFTEKFSKYYLTTKESGSEAGNKLLLELFKGNKPKQNLSKLLLVTINTSNKLKEPFIKWFPTAFSIQNIVMPWLSWIFPKGFMGRLFNFIKIINPWVDEFVNTHTALSGDEMLTINKITEKLVCAKQDKACSVEKNDDKKEEKVIGNITLGDSDVQGYELRQIRDSLDSGIKRLFGKQRNAASWLVTFLLNHYGFKDYEDFEAKVVQKPQIIRALHEHLRSIKGKEDVSFAQAFDLKDKLKDSNEMNVAKGILAILSITNNMPEKYIKTIPQYFGLPYSILYLTLPIINNFIGEKSFFGKCIGFIQRVSPIVNDLAVDIIASAFEEVTLVKKVMAHNNSLFEKLPTGSGVLKRSWDMLKETLERLKVRFQTKLNHGVNPIT